jgi:hypothetical protein
VKTAIIFNLQCKQIQNIDSVQNKFASLGKRNNREFLTAAKSMSNEQSEQQAAEPEAKDFNEREVKRPRTGDDGIDPNAHQEQTVAVDGEPASAPADPSHPEVERDPVRIGYKSFVSGASCYEYFHNIISKYRKNQNLNEVG